MDEPLGKDWIFIEGKITGGILDGVEIRIGPVPANYEFSRDMGCDTVFITHTCHPLRIECEKGPKIVRMMAAPCDTMNFTKGC